MRTTLAASVAVATSFWLSVMAALVLSSWAVGPARSVFAQQQPGGPAVPSAEQVQQSESDEFDETARGEADLAAAAAVAQLPALTPPFAEPGPGYVPIEIEAWWAPSTDPHGGWGHIHALYLERVGQLVTGDASDGDAANYVRDFRITLHNNPMKWKVFRLDLAPGTTIFKRTFKPVRPGPAEGTQSWNESVKIADAALANGRQTLRWRVTGDTPDGKVFTTSSEIQVLAGSGSGGSGHGAVLSQGPTACMGKGWYTNHGYGQVIVDTIPTGPVSGKYRFGVFGREGTERLTVTLDKMHAVPAVGPWLAQAASDGPTLLDTPAGDKQEFTVEVDTTMLANGWHQIAARNFTGKGSTSAGDPSGGTEKNVLQGKLNWWIKVQN
jgi:hypothetical protein